MTKHTPWKLALVSAAALLASCGGSDRIHFDSLVSFGDSLSDVGTHNVGTVAALAPAAVGGGRWTVNSPAGGEIWTERLAADLGLPKPCAAETGLSPNIPGLTGAPVTTKAGCTSYAQGSARVTSPLGPNSLALQALGQTTLGLLAKPVANQMAAHLTAKGAYSGNELVVVMAGANDVFMELALTAPASPTQAVSNAAAAGAALGQLVKTQVLAKGARYVLVLNVPDVAGTPYARALNTAQPGTGALIDSMVQNFNSQLATQLKDVTGVRLADAYAINKTWSANPAAAGFSNTTGVACGPNMLGGTSLVCNGTNKVAGDISRYQFADDVHPSPYGHQLLGEFAVKEMMAVGWR